MLKIFLLIFDPASTWEKIDAEQRSSAYIASTFLLPLLLISAVVEGFMQVKLGRTVGMFNDAQKLPLDVVVRYQATFVILTLLIVAGGSALLASMAQSFHSKHTFAGSFSTLSYSISPLLIFHIIDGFPAINTWVSFTVGILISVSHLYRAVPRTLKPEPSNALGMYIFAAVFLVISTGLAHYIGTLVLDEQILSGTPGL